MGKYRTIVADPPWEVERSPGGLGRKFGAGQSDWRSSTAPLAYRTMPINEIEALPVGELAEADAHLYLWTIQRHLEVAFGVVRAWGFSPVVTLPWCKQRGGFVGGTFYSNVEFVLFCRRGQLSAKERVNSQWFDWPRGRSEHSTKPDAFLDLVEQVSPGPYLELFARRARFGWDYWGDQSLGTAEMPEVAA